MAQPGQISFADQEEELDTFPDPNATHYGYISRASQANHFAGQVHVHAHNSFLASTLDGSADFGARPKRTGSLTIEDEACLRALRLSDPVEDRLAILHRKGELFRELCSWVYNDDAFSRWWDTADSHLFWLHGNPGKGKTMIMMSLIDELHDRIKRRDPSRHVMAYFFCQNTNVATSNAIAIIRGLLYMLVSQHRHLLRYVRQKFQMAGSQLFEGPNAFYSLWDILSNIAQDSRIDQVYLLVDALDECDPSVTTLLQFLVRNDVRMSKKIKWLVSSRNERHMQSYLGAMPENSHTSLEVNASRVTAAVSAYIDIKVEALQRSQGYDESLQLLVKNRLLGRADGTFLWVGLVCQQLAETDDFETLEAIDSFPSGLEALYGTMLARLDRQDTPSTASYCRKVLCAVFLAEQPLDLEELTFAADLPGDKFKQLESLKRLVTRCASFLVINEESNTVHFVHQSAKDYLNTGHETFLFPSGLSIAYAEVASRCLRYMMSNLREDICQRVSPDFDVRDLDVQEVGQYMVPALRFACLNWVYYIREAGLFGTEHVGMQTKDLIHRFFKHWVLRWLESLIILGSLDSGLNAMYLLESVLEGGQNASNGLYESLRDVIRLLLYFKPVLQKFPLQLYASVLMFSPSESLTRRNFAHCLSNWSSMPAPVTKKWNPLLRTCRASKEPIQCLNFSPDGSLLALASSGAISLLNAFTGIPLRILMRNHIQVVSLRFSTDGSRIAAKLENETVMVWETDTGASLYSISEHSHSITQETFSDDRRQTYSDLHDYLDRSLPGLRTVKAKGQLYMLTKDEGMYISGRRKTDLQLSYSSDGQRVSIWSDGEYVRIWHVPTGSIELVLRDDKIPWPHTMIFSTDGTMIAYSEKLNLVTLQTTIWDLRYNVSYKLKDPSASGDRCEGLLFSPCNGYVAYTKPHSTHVWIFDIKKESLFRKITMGTANLHSIAFSPDRETLVSGNRKGEIRFWNWVEAASQQPASEWSRIHSLSMSSDGNIAISASCSGYDVWDVLAQSPACIDAPFRKAYSVTLSSDGSSVASVWLDRIDIHDLHGELLFSIKEGDGCTFKWLTFSPTGQFIAYAYEGVKLWDVRKSRLITLADDSKNMHSNGTITYIEFNQDGTRLCTGSSGGDIHLWDMSGTLLCHLFIQGGEIGATTLSHDGTLIASCSLDSTIRISKIDGTRVQAIDLPRYIFSQLMFSQDNARIAYASPKRCYIWEVQSGQCLACVDLSCTHQSLEPNLCNNGFWLRSSMRKLLEAEPTVPMLTVKEEWICFGQKKLVWLPDEVRSCAFGISGNTVVLGSKSGRVVFIRIDPSRIP